MVDLRINETFPMHSQPPKSPLSGGLDNGPLSGELQGDFGNFGKVGVIGKCLLISLIHYKCRDRSCACPSKIRLADKPNARKRFISREFEFPLTLHKVYGVRRTFRNRGLLRSNCTNFRKKTLRRF